MLLPIKMSSSSFSFLISHDTMLSFHHYKPAWILGLINELPLVFVLFIFLWDQYTISISLVHSYLVQSRNLVGLGLSIAIPFNLLWFASLINLWRCIFTGPGWVQRINRSTAHQHQHLSPTQSTSYHQEPASVQHDYHHLEYPEVDDDNDDQNNDSRPMNQDSIPLLSPQNYHPLSPRSNPNLSSCHPSDRQPSPRPKSTLTSPPPYLAHRSTTPLSSLSFQEQVQPQPTNRSPHSTTDIFHALHFPPSPTSGLNPQSNQNAQQENSTTTRNQHIATLMCKSDGSLRFCRKCNHYKADRSHHCSSCGKCVLRMDHHCPWLGGRCVGLKNHKFFILFIFYTTITCIFSCVFAAKGLMEFVEDPASSVSNPSNHTNFELAPLNWAFLVLVSGLFGLVLAGFTSYHFYLISVNRTTIENMERSVRVRPISSNQYAESYALLRTTRLKGPENLRREMETPDLTMHNQNDPVNLNMEARDVQSSELRTDGGQMNLRRREEMNDSYSDNNVNNVTSSLLPSYDLPIYKSDYQLTRNERRKLESGSAKLNLFDRGSSLANFKEVFGNQSPFWHWFLPFHPIGISDGYKYQINQENLEKLIDLTSEIRLLPNHRSGELRFERP